MAPIIILAILAAAWLLSYWWLNRKGTGTVEIHNRTGGTDSALLAYQLGRDTFHSRVIDGFVKGLVAGGWKNRRAGRRFPCPGMRLRIVV
jgi:hypothetical protein